MKINIEIINAIESKVDAQGKRFLDPFMFITKEYWKPGPYKRKIRKTYLYPLINKHGHFLTGFLPKIKKLCEENDVEISWSGEISYPVNSDPFLPGIEFRPDQLSAIKAVVDQKRGVLKAPTGSGKTILALGIVSCFYQVSLKLLDSPRILYLAHTVSICGQVATEFEKYGYEVGRVFGGKVELNKQITIATRQSLIKQEIDVLEEIWGPWKIVILDEVHHLSSFKGQYADIFMNLFASIRIGLTATMPDAEESKMAVEGFIGPMINELSIQEAGKLDILATPKIKLLKVPGRTVSLTKYQDIYQSEIVENRNRNRLLLEVVKEKMARGETILILVTKIEHGEIIQRMAKRLFEIDISYLHGSSESEERELVKSELINKKTQCVIATAIWKEGVNIPTLDCVINACGGKSEIATLQAIGRGLRKTDEKDTVEIVDFLDTAKYLAEHTIRRLHIYVENGWL